MLVVAHDSRVKPLLEEVTAPPVARVERLRVSSVERVHAAGHRLALAEKDQMEVVRHQAVGQQTPAGNGRREAQEANEALTVEGVGLDRRAGDTTSGDVERAEVR